jgi:hypothetical protein
MSDAPLIGKPTAAWQPNDFMMLVVAVTTDRKAIIMGRDRSFVGEWINIPVDPELDPNDPDPSVSVQMSGDAYAWDWDFYARNARHQLVNVPPQVFYPPLGGVLASAPAATISRAGPPRVNVAALIDDHGRPGVWWRFRDDAGNYRPPCNYNAPGACAQCGCDVPNAPLCDE